MKIIFLCLGTRGDVQPYVAIGKEAQRRGHHVVVCTGKSFQGLVEDNDLVFQPCSLDLMAILQTEEGKLIYEQGMKHPLKALNYSRCVINPLYRKSMIEFYRACQSADLIVYHPKALGAVDIAEKLKKPCISMPLVPMVYPIKKFPNLAFTTRNLGSVGNRLTYMLANLGAEGSSIMDINNFRVTELNLPKRKLGQYMLKRENGSLPIIYPISKALFQGIEEFQRDVILTGFPVINTQSCLDFNVESFIKNGTSPIVVTFSSMPFKNPELFFEKFISAVRKSKNRAILLSGNSGLREVSDDQILMAPSMPHDLIFPYACGIVHHGGVGTMAAALRSGKPQVILPFHVDQPFWAKHLEELGYALPSLRENDSEKDIISRFQLFQNEQVRKRAEEIANIINKENPNETVVDCLENVYNSYFY